MKPTPFAVCRPVVFCAIAAFSAPMLAGCGTVKGALTPPDSTPPAHIVRLSAPQQAALYQQEGVMAASDYLRLVRIQNGIDRTQRLSDADVAFVVRQLAPLPVRNPSPAQVQAENVILSHTYGSPGHRPKQLTISQRNRLYTAIVPFTGSTDQWVQVGSSLALAGTRDPRAVPVLQRMAQSSPYAVVRLDANEWLKRLRAVGVTAGK